MTWQNYADKWPEELTKAQKGLKTNIAKGIYVYLLLSEKRAFSEIAKELDLEPNKLAYHLKNLVRYGLLSHEYSTMENQSERSFYKVSNFGNIYAKKVLEAARSPYQHQDIAIPPIPFKEKTEETIPIIMDEEITTSTDGLVILSYPMMKSNKPLKIDDYSGTTTEVVV